MRWVDVAGPPGVGKSTLCDVLWPPKSIQHDGKAHPREWAEFLECQDRLMQKIAYHPSIMACRSLVNRLLRKMEAVYRMKSDEVYIQTGFAQRGLGIGWRLKNPEDIAPYFELMPVSVGVVFLYADVKTVEQRNRDRGKDRSHMVALMERPREIGIEVLARRGVRVMKMDTRESVEANVRRLLDFAGEAPKSLAAGSRHQASVLPLSAGR